MRLIEFLRSTEWFDGELIVKDFYDSKFGFVWDDQVKITEAGKEKFRQILNSEIKMNGQVIILQDTTIPEQDYDYFMSMVAGHESAKDYDSYFKDV